MRLTPDAKGVFPIAPTPFHPDGRIDEASVDRMTDFYGEIGAAGLTVLGILASDAQRKPGAGLSATAKAEVDFLLERLGRHDPRARV